MFELAFVFSLFVFVFVNNVDHILRNGAKTMMRSNQRDVQVLNKLVLYFCINLVVRNNVGVKLENTASMRFERLGICCH